MSEVVEYNCGDEVAADRAVGQRLRIVRLRLGLNEREAAAAAEVTLRTWRRYEAGAGGYMTWPTIRFSRRYGLSLDWLYYGDGRRPPPCRKPRLSVVSPNPQRAT